MKRITHPVVTALSLTNLLLLFLTSPLTSKSHLLVCQWSGPISVILVPVSVAFALCWLILSLLLIAAKRLRWLRIVTWIGIAGLLPLGLSRAWALSTGQTMPLWPEGLNLVIVIFVLFLSVSPWRGRTKEFIGRLYEVALVVIGLGAVGAVLTVGQMAWIGWNARHLDAPPKLRPIQNSVNPPGPPIVWIIFDELSYEQVFEARYPGLMLPAFDRLAGGATVFTHVVPAGLFTSEVLPTLLTGQTLAMASASGDGRLLTVRAADGGERVFDPHSTIFQDALDAGYVTGISGWYIPYCRLLPSVLNQCFWVFNRGLVNGISPGRSSAENLRGMARYALFGIETIWNRLRHRPALDLDVSETQAQDYRLLMRATDGLVESSDVDFELIHLPVPHPLGFYDRSTGKFSNKRSTYIDNLSLADVTLAHIRETLEHEGKWDKSVVMIMGDHSWRTSFIWRQNAGWTKEEEIASHGGRFDERPGYIVKLPGQQVGTRIDTRFGAIYTRAMLDEFMQGKLRSPEELAAWAKEQPQVASPAAQK